MTTNTAVAKSKAIALRRKKALRVKKLKNLRDNLLLTSLCFTWFLYLVILDLYNFTSFGFLGKISCLSILGGLSFLIMHVISRQE